MLVLITIYFPRTYDNTGVSCQENISIEMIINTRNHDNFMISSGCGLQEAHLNPDHPPNNATFHSAFNKNSGNQM